MAAQIQRQKLFKATESSDPSVDAAIKTKYHNLGTMSFHEKAVLTLFILMILLWFFRDPYIIPGWAALFSNGKYIKDATPGLAVIVLLFLIPSNPSCSVQSPGLIDWKTTQSKVPWGVLILMGGSFSMAKALVESGLSGVVSDYLANLKGLPAFLLVILLCLITAMITNIASNTATASVLLPITANLAKALKIHPFLLMLPVALTASYAFLFPMATPPNAMVYDHSKITIWEMAKAGAVINIACMTVQVISVFTYGVLLFDLNTFPHWADAMSSSSSNATAATA